MGVFSTIAGSIKTSIAKKRQEEEELNQMRRQMSMQMKIQVEQEQKERSFQQDKERAMREANKLTGMPRLRAINRLHALENKQFGFLDKLSEYTIINKARREANLKRTEARRKAAMEMRMNRGGL